MRVSQASTSAKPQARPCVRVAGIRQRSSATYCSSPQAPRHVAMRASPAQVEDLEEIDPNTGMPVLKTSVASSTAGRSVVVNGLRWAYRENDVDASKADAGVSPVLMLHGIGSCSFSYRTCMALFGKDGVRCIAPDWIGHGDSDKPTSTFDYSEEAYLAALDGFIKAKGLGKFSLVVQGFVLGQYGLLYALANPDKIDRLVILNTPVGLKTKLRAELAAYKNPLPFLRPGNKPFNGLMYNITGSPYAWQERDAKVYGQPYLDSPEASAAIAAVMDKVDFNKLLKKVDDGFYSWRNPSILLFGANDPFVDVSTMFEFLDTKRTNMKCATVTAKLGHMPQEDFPDAVYPKLSEFLTGKSDGSDTTTARMTKGGVVEM